MSGLFAAGASDCVYIPGSSSQHSRSLLRQSRYCAESGVVVCLQPNKVVILLTGRYAGKKAVIVKNNDDGSSGRAYGHAIVAGLAKEPRKVRCNVDTEITGPDCVLSFIPAKMGSFWSLTRRLYLVLCRRILQELFH